MYTIYLKLRECFIKCILLAHFRYAVTFIIVNFSCARYILLLFSHLSLLPVNTSPPYFVKLCFHFHLLFSFFLFSLSFLSSLSLAHSHEWFCLISQHLLYVLIIIYPFSFSYQRNNTRFISLKCMVSSCIHLAKSVSNLSLL